MVVFPDISFSKRDAPTSRLTKRVPSPSPQAVYEKLRESERMRLKMQNRLAHAQEDLRAARGEPPSPHSPGSSFRSGKDADADYDHDKYPMYATTVLMCIALWYFYDLPDDGDDLCSRHLAAGHTSQAPGAEQTFDPLQPGVLRVSPAHSGAVEEGVGCDKRYGSLGRNDVRGVTNGCGGIAVKTGCCTKRVFSL